MKRKPEQVVQRQAIDALDVYFWHYAMVRNGWRVVYVVPEPSGLFAIGGEHNDPLADCDAIDRTHNAMVNKENDHAG